MLNRSPAPVSEKGYAVPEQASPAEQRRLAAVEACEVLDTPREAAFDNIVFIAAQLFRVPMAKLAVVAKDRVWIKASVGRLPQNLPLNAAFCHTVVETGNVLVIEDALSDQRFAKFPMVAAPPHVRFYAGVPLHGPGAEIVGTLSVLDNAPRTVPDRARSQLLQLAREAEVLLSQRAPT